MAFRKQSAEDRRRVLKSIPARFAVLIASAFIGTSAVMSQKLDALSAELVDSPTLELGTGALAVERLQAERSRLREGLADAKIEFAVALLIACLLILAYAQYVSLRLNRMSAALRALADGDLAVRVPAGSSDEVDEMANSINATAEAISGALLTERVNWDMLKREAQRLPYPATMVEYASYGMMFASPDLRIEYLNPELSKLLTQLSPEFNMLPESWLGVDLGALHPEFESLRSYAANWVSLPHETILHVGSEHLDITLTPAFSTAGVYQGVLLTSSLASARLDAIEREGEHKAALDTLLSEVAGNIETLLNSANSMTELGHRMSASSKATSQETARVKEFTVQVDGSVSNAASLVAQGQDGIQRIAQMSQEASAVAVESQENARVTAEEVKRLTESSREISRVTRLIDEIAGRTNLLALNATIEASTAGAAGRGFAVVAKEVKELARRASHATTEINERVEAIQRDADRSLVNIGSMIETIEHITDLQDHILQEVKTEEGLTEAIRISVEEVALHTSEIRRIGEAVAAAAKLNISGAADSEQAAVALTSVAINLGGLMARFNVAHADSHYAQRLSSAKQAAEENVTEAELF